MTNKYDLETKLFNISGDASVLTYIGTGQIPTGKTRFLTYIRVERITNVTPGAAGVTGMFVAVASSPTIVAGIDAIGSLAGSLMTTFGKLPLSIATILTMSHIPKDALTMEVKGTIKEPILSVAGTKYMMLGSPEDTASVAVFAQYFDA